MWKNAIQYMAPGFEPTTFRTWVVTHNHLTRAPAKFDHDWVWITNSWFINCRSILTHSDKVILTYAVVAGNCSAKIKKSFYYFQPRNFPAQLRSFNVPFLKEPLSMNNNSIILQKSELMPRVRAKSQNCFLDI